MVVRREDSRISARTVPAGTRAGTVRARMLLRRMEGARHDERLATFLNRSHHRAARGEGRGNSRAVENPHVRAHATIGIVVVQKNIVVDAQ